MKFHEQMGSVVPYLGTLLLCLEIGALLLHFLHQVSDLLSNLEALLGKVERDPGWLILTFALRNAPLGGACLL